MQQDREPTLGRANVSDPAGRVAELEKLIADLEKSVAESEKLSTMKSTVLKNLSHEIRTPLAAIVGFAAILQEEMSDRHKKFLDFIERSGKRLMDALNSILNLSMLEEGSYRLHPESVDISQEIEEDIAGLRRAAEQKGLALILQFSQRGIEAQIDRTAVDRIVHNLVENAIHFTENGTVEIDVATAADRLVIRVSDTGPGIRSEFKEVMFDAFAQESEFARSYDGVGLGLTITKRLVDLMGGEIEVESQLGRGTVFTVSIPGVVTETQESVSRVSDDRRDKSATTEEDASSNETKPSVLAVEDNPDMLILLQHLLSSRWEVSTASDGKTALSLANQHRFDAVLMDINLGEDETGVDVMLKIRQLAGYEGTPIVAVTAYALPGDRERFLQAGFDGYIGKPFTKQQLFRMMDQVLAKG